MRRDYLWLISALFLFGCGHGSGSAQEGSGEEPDSKAADHNHDHGHEELPTRLTLTEQVIADAGIKTAPVKREALSRTIALAGEIAADPDRLARVSAPLSGRIEEVSLKEGMDVKRGDPLVKIRAPEVGKARGALLAAQAQAKAAHSNVDRLKKLLDQKLVSNQEYDNAVAQASALDAEARALAAELSAMGTTSGGASVTLRAPIAGTIVSRNAVLGQPVTADTVLATIAELSVVWFLARVFEKDLGQIQIGAPAEVELNAYPGQRFLGAVEYVGRQVDPIARSITARVVLEKPDERLRLGLFGRAHLEVGQGAHRALSIVVPRSAVAEIAGKKVVFVRESGTEFNLHDITLGDSASGKVEVLAGLREGESVVVEGVFTLKSGILKSAFAEDEH